MTMDPKSKNIDCYFFYYSECVRGNFCKFRHEPSALGCEEMCMKWKEGSCSEPHCSLRHMELKKKRKEIPCYWEKQPGGCRKAHCAFKHQSKAEPAQADSSSSTEGATKPDSETAPQDWRNAKTEAASSLEPASDPVSGEASRRLSQGGPDSFNSSPAAALEPIVVNFEEESDSETAPSWTPTKVPKEKESLHVKTLEEIRLERMQAESAAYWEGIAGGPMAWEAANPAANPSASPCGIVPASRKLRSTSTVSFKKANYPAKSVTKDLDFKVLSLDEIRKNRARKTDTVSILNDSHNLNMNGYTDDQSQCMDYELGILDLREKIKGSSKSWNGSTTMNCRDPVNLKRQREEDSVTQIRLQKRQCMKIRRFSDLSGESTPGNDINEAILSVESDSNRLMNDIDRLLRE